MLLVNMLFRCNRDKLLKVLYSWWLSCFVVCKSSFIMPCYWIMSMFITCCLSIDIICVYDILRVLNHLNLIE